jgi:hypothetical protein
MDRSYLLHSPTLPSIEDFGISMFRDNVFMDASLEKRVLQGACDLVAKARNESSAEESTSSLFKEAIGMYHVLAVYTRSFEPLFLQQSVRFFEEWSEEKREKLGLAEYVEQCHALFRSETERCDTFTLDESTKRSLVLQMEEVLVCGQEDKLTDIVGVVELLDDDQFQALKSLYELLEKQRLGEKLRPAFEEYINTEGSYIVFDENREREMVVRLLQFKRKLDFLWETSFGKNQSLGHGLREAFEQFINKTKKSSTNWGTDNDKPGEMIAKYVDQILKGGLKAVPESASGLQPLANDEDIDDDDVDEDLQINKQLDQVLDLFRFVHGKAVFEAFYKKDLAKRLLMNRSASADAEKSMLDRLKNGKIIRFPNHY